MPIRTSRSNFSREGIRTFLDYLGLGQRRPTPRQQYRQLELTYAHQINRLNQFGDLGRVFLHDLINPLTALSFCIDQLQENTDKNLAGVTTHVNRAFQATRRLEKYLRSLHKQLRSQTTPCPFSPQEEIEEALEVLDCQSRRLGIQLRFTTNGTIKLVGDSVAFHKVVVNLVRNALAASTNLPRRTKKTITLRLKKTRRQVLFSIHDWGTAIKQVDIAHIFDPFFMPVGIDRGLGIGLSILKQIVEHELHGTITATSSSTKGTTFIVKVPASNPLFPHAQRLHSKERYGQGRSKRRANVAVGIGGKQD